MDDESVVLELIDGDSLLTDDGRGAAEEILQEKDCGHDTEAIFISTEGIKNWNLRLVLSSPVIRILANRDRLIQQSSYFHGLLGGNFRESTCNVVSIHWNRDAVIKVLQFIFCCPLDLAADNFLNVLEGALFFGVDTLLVECEDWFRCRTTAMGTGSLQMSLDVLIKIWNFAVEHAISFIPELCEGYLAWNFAWAVSGSSFPFIPYDLLSASIRHPLLTVESEKQLCEALLVWLSNNCNSGQFSSTSFGDCCPDFLGKVRSRLLPLDFVAENRGNPFFAKLADEGVSSFDLIKDSSVNLPCNLTEDGFAGFHIRLTEFSQRIDLSGCSQINTSFLLLSVLPSLIHANTAVKKREKHFLMETRCFNENRLTISPESLPTLSFQGVCEVDISKCRRLHLDNFVKCFYMSFPSLRVLKATHCLQFKMSTLCSLIQKFPLLNEVDLTVDISPVVAKQVTVVSSSTERYQDLADGPHVISKESPSLTYIAKLSLEGRTDINDLDLQIITLVSSSLSRLNLKGCSSVTDEGISNLISKCQKLRCLVVSYTCFGRNSILGLCSELNIPCDFLGQHQQHKGSSTLAYRLLELDISSCKNVDQSSLCHLLHCTYMMKNLSLKDTCSGDDMLFAFRGSTLESLDVSDTMVSGASLAYIIQRNAGLKFLKARGCRNLHLHGSNLKKGTSPSESHHHLGRYDRDELYYELSRKCMLEEIAFGWGFSPFLLQVLRPSIQTLRSITVGVGASLGESALTMLPDLCPLLETVVLHFQVLQSKHSLSKFMIVDPWKCTASLGFQFVQAWIMFQLYGSPLVAL